MKLFLFSYSFFLLTACSNMQVGANKESSSEKEIPLQKEKYSKTEALLPDAYVDYITNPANGLFVTKQIGDIDFSVLYKPNPFVALSILRFDSLVESRMNKELEELKGMQYYTFKISIQGFNEEILKYKLTSTEEYEQRVNYFSFQMQNDLKLIEGTDTLNCLMYHFERNYGVAPNATFVLGFPASENERLVLNKTISYTDNVFGAGIVNMIINKEDLVRIPDVKLNL